MTKEMLTGNRENASLLKGTEHCRQDIKQLILNKNKLHGHICFKWCIKVNNKKKLLLSVRAHYLVAIPVSQMSHCSENHKIQYDGTSDQLVMELIFFFEQSELQWWSVCVCGGGTYPLNVSRDRSLLLGLGGGGRMLSVTGATVLPGEPSSWMMKSEHQHCSVGSIGTWAHRVTRTWFIQFPCILKLSTGTNSFSVKIQIWPNKLRYLITYFTVVTLPFWLNNGLHFVAGKMPSTQTLTELMSLSVSIAPPIRKRMAFTTSSLDKTQSTSLEVIL